MMIMIWMVLLPSSSSSYSWYVVVHGRANRMWIDKRIDVYTHHVQHAAAAAAAALLKYDSEYDFGFEYGAVVDDF